MKYWSNRYYMILWNDRYRLILFGWEGCFQELYFQQQESIPWNFLAAEDLKRILLETSSLSMDVCFFKMTSSRIGECWRRNRPNESKTSIVMSNYKCKLATNQTYSFFSFGFWTHTHTYLCVFTFLHIFPKDVCNICSPLRWRHDMFHVM